MGGVTDPRPGWDQYFLGIAQAVSIRGDCTRRQVGCVLVLEHRIVSTGYNGPPAGRPGCLTAGACPRGAMPVEDVPAFSRYDVGPGRCIAVHAEANALLDAGRAARGATAYITCEPCPDCCKLLEGAGVIRAIYPEGSLEWRTFSDEELDRL